MERPLRGLLLLWLASAVLTAAGCRAQATPTAGPTPAIGLTQTATLAPTEEAPVVEQATATTAAVEGDVTEMATQTQAATQPAVTQPAAVSQPVPDPSLFEMSWQERGPFQAGLLDGAEAALEELQAASVYHMDLELSNDLTQLAGRQEVFYTNREDVPLEEVYLRLFPNLADGRTTINATWVNGIEVQPNF